MDETKDRSGNAGAPSVPLPPMNHYVLGLFRRAPDARPIPPTEVEVIQEAHVANLLRLTREGMLLAAGPFEEDGELRGVLIFATDSVERAREAMRTDPAIVAGRLVLDLYTWFSPQALAVDPARPPGSPLPR